MTKPATGTTATQATDLPGPPGLPLLGNLLQFKPSRAHRVMEAWARQYGPFFGFRLGTKRIVGVADPEAIKTILHERPDTFGRMKPLDEIFREMGILNLFSSEGEPWRRQRRIWLAAMNAHQVRPFHGRMTEITERLRQRWAHAARAGEAVDVISELMRYTVDVVTLYAYGHDGNTLEKGEDVIQQHVQHVFPAINRRWTSPVPYWRYLPLPADRRLDKALEQLRAFVMSRIEAVRTRMEAQPELRERPENLLESLIVADDADEEGLTDEEIYGNATVALVAGEDTTALSIAWMIHELMQHPAVLDRLREEVDEVLDENRLWSDLSQGDELAYLEAVMRETMRHRPVAPYMLMTAKEDVALGGWQFRAGTHFIPLMRVPAMHKQRHTDHEAYSPQRWLDEQAGHFTQKPPFPFGGGKRTCPGMNLAQMEIKSVIAMLVRNFEFTRPADDPPVEEQLVFTMQPKNLRMQLRKR